MDRFVEVRLRELLDLVELSERATRTLREVMGDPVLADALAGASAAVQARILQPL